MLDCSDTLEAKKMQKTLGWGGPGALDNVSVHDNAIKNKVQRRLSLSLILCMPYVMECLIPVKESTIL